MAHYTLGVDLGTSGAKAALVDLDTFKLTSIAMQSYDNGALQPTEMLWDATAATIRAAVAGIDPSAIRAISFSAQMHGIVMVDRRGGFMGPMINHLDTRCDIPLVRYGNRTTIQVMTEMLAGPDFDDLGVHVLSSGYLGATLFYLKENDPVIFDQIDHVLLPSDFVRAQLLGASDRATDTTQAFGSGIFNTRLSCWDDRAIEKLGLARAMLPAVHRSTEVAGVVPARVAGSLGLAAGTPVVYGGGDNQMSLLGNGLISTGSPVLVNIGTSAQISQVTSQYARKPGIDTRSFFFDSFAFVGAILGGGGSYAALRDALCKREGRGVSYTEMDELASQAPAGSAGLMYLPAARGVTGPREIFVGRTELNDIGHQARAVMEGIILHLYDLRPPTMTDGPGFMVGAGKGLQKGRVWSQMAADVFDRTIKITNFENAVWGAALIAALGIGAISNPAEAVSTIEYTREFDPNPANVSQYKQLIAERKAS